MEGHLPLNELLDLLSQSSRVQICLYDAAGILLLPELSISEKYRTHTAHFCDLAKDTDRGFHLCVHCKTRANQKAIEEGQDIISNTVLNEYKAKRLKVRDTDKGREIATQVDNLMRLLAAYRRGLIHEAN